ncbi:hypothetical protein [Roseibium polysiphoniae]|uniref:Flagellar basal body-associated protein FliL n=1 Tax=Roseibium polysiphoniae TaxID=2571221 RepID=A0A944GSG0_9HYPH|nr:hypothetical protein [Roseibium polysiphoniae]MBD8877038.1 hypothetical protein [Roseibium polysiphoniae]MBS8260783.1 hypothetical protein [Roseibium polysiphoniae]
MIKMLVVGLWMPIAALGSSYATVYWMNDKMAASDGETAGLGGLDYETIRPVNVPILSDGALQGYVVAKLVFTADADALRELPVPPHPFLIDEAFRRIYADEALDFKRLERYDLDALTSHLKGAANQRIGSDVVQDVLVEEFNYFDKDVVITH